MDIVKSFLYNNFDMKDIRVSNMIFEVKITRFEKRISLYQSHYVKKILKKYN